MKFRPFLTSLEERWVPTATPVDPPPPGDDPGQWGEDPNGDPFVGFPPGDPTDPTDPGTPGDPTDPFGGTDPGDPGDPGTPPGDGDPTDPIDPFGGF